MSNLPTFCVFAFTLDWPTPFLIVQLSFKHKAFEMILSVPIVEEVFSSCILFPNDENVLQAKNVWKLVRAIICQARTFMFPVLIIFFFFQQSALNFPDWLVCKCHQSRCIHHNLLLSCTLFFSSNTHTTSQHSVIAPTLAYACILSSNYFASQAENYNHVHLLQKICQRHLLLNDPEWGGGGIPLFQDAFLWLLEVHNTADVRETHMPAFLLVWGFLH